MEDISKWKCGNECDATYEVIAA